MKKVVKPLLKWLAVQLFRLAVKCYKAQADDKELKQFKININEINIEQ